MVTTASAYAKELGITDDAARYRLNKLVKAGKAVTWIEKEDVLSNVFWDGNLHKRVRYYDVEKGVA